MGPTRELYGVTVTVPTIATAVGVDGGGLFQIVGLQELGIDARTMGIGLGLGVLSVPRARSATDTPRKNRSETSR
jgi:hypothetical protein